MPVQQEMVNGMSMAMLKMLPQEMSVKWTYSYQVHHEIGSSLIAPTKFIMKLALLSFRV
jgi:hypothetical protein